MNFKHQKKTSETPKTPKGTRTFTEKDAQEAISANKEKAEELLKDGEKMNDFLGHLEKKFNSVTGLKEKFSDIPIIVSLIRSYIKGEYKEIPLGTLIGLVGALIYFLSPVDIIPDFLPGVGYVDDIMVIAVAIRFAYTDLEDYKKWMEQQENS